MKTVITYSSKTGNTKKVAEAIHLAIPNADLKPVDELMDFNYDLIILGGWIDKGIFDQKALAVAEKIFDKKIAFFFTLGAYPDSQHAKECVFNITKLLEKNNNKVIGHYFCQGAIDPNLIAWLSSLPSDNIMSATEERKKRWADASTHPDEMDLKNAYNRFKDILVGYKEDL